MNSARFIAMTANSAAEADRIARERAVKIDTWHDGTKVYHMDDGSALKIEGERFSALPTAMVY